ncbi:hypothetical protein OF83DRAFT_1293287 [Amylostereum chailletii]|nr:hypothetical protein OF83DRAFT_1293287 [Amylostereum chailletii]
MHASTSRKAPKRKASQRSNKRARRSKVADESSKDTPAIILLMPLDVLVEILQQLPPDGLYHMALLNKSFRQLLLSPGFDWLWRISFQNDAHMPPRPSGVSYYGWSHILFSNGICHCCGGGTPAKFMFTFRKRVCGRCAPKQYYSGRQDVIRMPDRFVSILGFSESSPLVSSFLPTVLNHISSTRFGGELCEKKAVSDFFAELGKRCDAAGIGSNKEEQFVQFENLVREKSETLVEHMKHVEICNNWQKNLRTERINQRTNSIKARFLALGYTEREWERSGLKKHEKVKTDAPLTDNGWKRVRRVLLPFMETGREEVRRDEAYYRRLERSKTVEELCAEVLMRVPPMELSHMPTQEGGYRNVPCIDGFLDTDVPMDEVWCADVRKVFETMVDNVRREVSVHKERIAGLIPTSFLDATTPSDPEHLLTLAVSVFERPRDDDRNSSFPMFPKAYWGLEALEDTPLYRKPEDSPTIVFSARATAMVRALLTRLGLPETTTTEELDVSTSRFACQSCLTTREHSIALGRPTAMPTVYALTWRETVNHILEKHWKEENIDISRVVVGDELAGVLEREVAHSTPPYRWSRPRCWSCCHCVAIDRVPHSMWMLKSDAVGHAKLKHGVTKPVENVDFFFNRSVPRSRDDKRYRSPVHPHEDAEEWLDWTGPV